MGMESGAIRNRAITSSSQQNSRTPPYSARLRLRKMGAVEGGWIPKYYTRREWLQVSNGNNTDEQNNSDHDA